MSQTMVMTDEDARRSLEELNKENNVVQEEVKKVCIKFKLSEIVNILSFTQTIYFCN